MKLVRLRFCRTPAFWRTIPASQNAATAPFSLLITPAGRRLLRPLEEDPQSTAGALPDRGITIHAAPAEGNPAPADLSPQRLGKRRFAVEDARDGRVSAGRALPGLALHFHPGHCIGHDSLQCSICVLIHSIDFAGAVFNGTELSWKAQWRGAEQTASLLPSVRLHCTNV